MRRNVTVFVLKQMCGGFRSAARKCLMSDWEDKCGWPARDSRGPLGGPPRYTRENNVCVKNFTAFFSVIGSNIDMYRNIHFSCADYCTICKALSERAAAWQRLFQERASSFPWTLSLAHPHRGAKSKPWLASWPPSVSRACPRAPHWPRVQQQCFISPTTEHHCHSDWNHFSLAIHSLNIDKSGTYFTTEIQ